MENISTIPRFQHILLKVAKHLAQNTEEFRFYCKKILPESDSVIYNLRDMFGVLEEQDVLSYQNVEILRDFAVAINRPDVEKMLLEYKTKVDVGMILQGYFDFRSGSRKLPEYETDFVSKYLAQACDDSIWKIFELEVNRKDGFPFHFVVWKFIQRNVRDLKEELSWKKVLEIIQICADFVYVHYVLTRNFKQIISHIEEIIENVLNVMINVVPWIAEKGGISKNGCSFVIDV